MKDLVPGMIVTKAEMPKDFFNMLSNSLLLLWQPELIRL